MGKPIGGWLRRVALAGTAMAVMGAGLMPGPAAAQANPELDQLRSQVQALLNRIEQLERAQQETQRTARAAKTAAEKAKTGGDPTLSSGNRKIKLSVSGQVNRGAMYVNDGDRDDVLHVDNDNSSTRVRFIGSGQVNDDVSVGTQIEVQIESNSSISASLDDDRATGSVGFTERKLELYLDSTRLGRVWLGQGDTASNGSSESDLSGTAVVALTAGTSLLGGGVAFRQNGTLGPTIGNVFSDFDGLSRDDRIRYDTPSFGGFKGSVSHVSGGAWDAALRYSASYGGARAQAAVAFANASGVDNRNYDQLNGSASVLFANGINLSVAAGTRDVDNSGRDPLMLYGKLGYQADLWSGGKTAFAADVSYNEDVSSAGDEATAYGAYVVQNIDAVAMELYAGIRAYELDRPGWDFDTVWLGLAGARVKF